MWKFEHPMRTLGRTALCICPVLALSACASSIWAPDAGLGQTVRQAQRLQTIDPQAALRAPVEQGADGAIAKAAIDRYQKSFETLPPPVNVLNIGVGTGVNASGTR
jgi:hypothetical protein